MRDDGDGAAFGGVEDGFGRDAKAVIDGGGQVFGAVGVAGGAFSAGAGVAHDDAVFHAAAYQGERCAGAPVIAAGGVINAGGTAEFAGDHHERVVQHAPLGQIAEQGGHACVEFGEQSVFQHVKVIVVRIPVAVMNQDATDARFNEPPRHQAGLPQSVSAVFVAKFFRFLADVKRPFLFRAMSSVQRRVLEMC